MKVDGVYKFIVPSPMGKQKVTVTIESVSETEANGSIHMFNKTTPFTGAKVDGDRITLKTVVKSGVGRFPFEVDVRADGEYMEGWGDTPFGKVDLKSVGSF